MNFPRLVRVLPKFHPLLRSIQQIYRRHLKAELKQQVPCQVQLCRLFDQICLRNRGCKSLLLEYLDNFARHTHVPSGKR